MTSSMMSTADAVLEEIVRARQSVRAFLPAPVEPAVLERLLAIAQQAPSWANVQPWRTHLLSGDAVRELSERLLEADEAGRGYDIPPPEHYDEPFRGRRRESGLALYASLGIRKEDADRRAAQAAENLRFFGAPHVAIVTAARGLGAYAYVDTGVYLSHLLLAAQSLGLGSIAQASVAGRAAVVRQAIGIPEDEVVVAAVAIGLPDRDHPANAFRTDRAPLAETITHVHSLDDATRLDD